MTAQALDEEKKLRNFTKIPGYLGPKLVYLPSIRDDYATVASL